MEHLIQLRQLRPLLFNYFKYIHQHPKHLSECTYLFHGYPYSGKEWAVRQILCLFNCPSFLQSDHDLLHCPVCMKIQTLSQDAGIYCLLTDFDTTTLSTLLSFETNKLDNITKIETINALSKLTLAINQQMYKDNPPAYSLFQPILEMVQHIKPAIMKDQLDNIKKDDFIKELDKIRPIIQDTNIKFCETILDRLSHTSAVLPYRALIIKNPTQMPALLLNRLLKLVEEPPTKTLIFFLTQNPHRLLPTIRSRCTAFHIPSYSKENISLIGDNAYTFPIHLFNNTIPPDPSLNDAPTKKNVTSYIDCYRNKNLPHTPWNETKNKILDRLYEGVSHFNLDPARVQDVLDILLKKKD